MSSAVSISVRDPGILRPHEGSQQLSCLYTIICELEMMKLLLTGRQYVHKQHMCALNNAG